MRFLTFPLLVCSVLVSGPAPLMALEFRSPNMLLLSPEEIDMCINGDGCSLVPDQMLRDFIEKRMAQAYKAGQATCGKTI